MRLFFDVFDMYLKDIQVPSKDKIFLIFDDDSRVELICDYEDPYYHSRMEIKFSSKFNLPYLSKSRITEYMKFINIMSKFKFDYDYFGSMMVGKINEIIHEYWTKINDKYIGNDINNYQIYYPINKHEKASWNLTYDYDYNNTKMVISNYINKVIYDDENFKLKIFSLVKLNPHLNPHGIDEIFINGYLTFYDVIISFKDKNEYPFEELLLIIKNWEEWMETHDQTDNETDDEYYKRVYKYSDELIKKYVEEINKQI